MKTISLKNLCTTTSLLVGLGAMSSAQADIFGGFLPGAVAAATDVYGITCPLGTTAVNASVNDGAGAGVLVNVQVIDPQGSATNAAAPDGGGPSPIVGVAAGAGNYLVVVDKRGAAANEGYALFLDCIVGGAPLAGTQSFLVQNQ